METDYRHPTTIETFSSTYKLQLLEKQSTHFVNKTLTEGSATAGLVDMPRELSLQPKAYNGMFVEPDSTGLLIGTYLKKNWPVILLAVAVGIGFALVMANTIYKWNGNSNIMSGISTNQKDDKKK